MNPTKAVLVTGSNAGLGLEAARQLAAATGTHVSADVDDLREYGLVKLLGTAWMRDLARRHGDRLRVLSVSPGMTTGTNAAEAMPWPMRWVMKTIAMPLMRLLGKAHDVESGAARYLRGLEDPSLVNGGFYGSPGTGLTGALTLQSAAQQPLLEDDAFSAAVGRLMERVAHQP